MEKVNREVATVELESWFEKKKIKESQKTTQKDATEVLIEAIMDGDLILNTETNVFTHKLLFPVGLNESIKELNYKPRLNDKMLKPYLEGNKPGSGTDLIISYASALTSTVKGILETLDSADKRIYSSIVVFFL